MKLNNLILVTGANGQLAKSMLKVYPQKNLYLAVKDKLDVTNKDQIKKIILKFRPDIIFHLASLTRGDECAKNPKMAFRINVEGTRNVVNLCKQFDIPLLFVSTNEVFDGRKKSPYTEEDKPNPITIVGKTKLEAENIIRENLEKYFIIRTSWLYSKWSRNFLHVIFSKVNKYEKIKIVEDEFSSPTYSLDLAIAIKKLIASRKYGLYHLVNEGIASRLQLVKKAFEFYDVKEVEIVPIKLKDFNRLSKPPLFTPLKNTKAKKLGIILPKWEDGLRRFLKTNNLQVEG